MKNKIIAFFFFFAAVIAVAGIVFISREKEQENPIYGIFSWNVEAIQQKEQENWSRCIRESSTQEIYQEIPMEMLKEKTTEYFIEYMSKENVKVYALVGQASWGRNSEGTELIKQIKAIAKYNANVGKNAKICGVMVDVEPYLLEEWDEGEESREHLMEQYYSGMRKAYECSEEYGIQFLVCIPTFYDVTNEDILEKLASKACDGLAVMNYNREDEYGQIEAEAELAQKYEKRLICIYELQEAGKHDLQEINTYAGEGLKKLWASADRLKEKINYDGFTFAYHYYEPLKKMLP